MRLRNRSTTTAIERRRAESEAEIEALRAQRERLSAALDALAEAAVVVDQSGVEIARNTAAERYLNARSSEVLAETAIERLLAAALAGYSQQEELTLVGPPRQHLIVRAEPLIVGGALSGAVASISDVSEMRRVEQVRRDFVANVSHELKTPIGALALLAETIGSLGEGMSEQGANLVDRLVREAERLGHAVDQLLDLSVIESSDAPAQELVAVRAVLDEAIERVAHSASARRIAIEQRNSTAELEVAGDPQQLVSAVANLLDNAVKYSDGGSSGEVSAELTDGMVVIEVRDHGIGIPARDIERVFERFYRVDRARSRETGGVGLGLSIVRHVIEGHGGSITVTSVEGKGSTFRISLPPAAAQL